MNLQEVESVVRQTILGDEESLTTRGNCRQAVETLATVVSSISQRHPDIKVFFFASKPHDNGTNVHYALGVTDGNQTVLINPVGDNGYPEYIGPLSEAPGLLKDLQATDVVV